MKVTVQNSATHGLSRKEAETIIRMLPPSIRRIAKSLVLYGTREPEICVTYHEKEQVIGLYWPMDRNPPPLKSEAINELLAALSIIAESGNLPGRVSHSLRSRHLAAVSAIAKKCEEAFSQ
ncbi:MAG: hypothetical protein AB1899_18580 [Pseudomonadota bacterium]